MSKLFPKQRHQHQSLNLKLCLLGSICIHALIALAFARRQPLQSIDQVEITPITIVGRSTSVDVPQLPKNNNVSQPKAQPKPPAPKPEPPVESNTTPPPEVTAPPKPPESQPDPPVLTSTESQVATQPKLKSEIEPPIEKQEIIKPEPDLNRNKPDDLANINQKPPTSNPDKPPAKLKPLKPQNNPVSREDSDQPNSIAKSEKIVPKPQNSSPQQSESVSDPAEDSSDASNSETESNDTKTAANNLPEEIKEPLAISCEENCLPEYPEALDGAEGTAGIKLTINSEGKVIDAAIAVANANPDLNQEALEAAKEMEFSQIDRDRAIVQINITFTVE